jgi:hypothetical protein
MISSSELTRLQRAKVLATTVVTAPNRTGDYVTESQFGHGPVIADGMNIKQCCKGNIPEYPLYATLNVQPSTIVPSGQPFFVRIEAPSGIPIQVFNGITYIYGVSQVDLTTVNPSDIFVYCDVVAKISIANCLTATKIEAVPHDPISNPLTLVLYGVIDISAATILNFQSFESYP